MRKLLNTLYVTKETGYLSLDGENVVLSENGRELVRLPFTNLESIYCFNYLGCRPALMGKCADTAVALCFLTPSGRFLARVVGETKGNVYLRKNQIEIFSNPEKRLCLVRTILNAKLRNVRSLLMRSRRDYPSLDEGKKISECIELFERNLSKIDDETDIEVLRGLEGESAKAYFHVFSLLILQQREDFVMLGRTKRPPLDRVNAVLSFLYTICTNDIASALECVGLDPYIGIFHTLRPGRVSLACDIMEEFRSAIDRMTISAINLKIIQKDDFEVQVSGAVLLSDSGRKKVISLWQDRKREKLVHPIIKEKIEFGLFPYVQANLLSKYVRGESDNYTPLLVN